MTMIETMRHFGIVVDDLDASLLFYKKYFGFEIEIDAHEKGSFIEKILAKDGIELRTVKLLSKASDVIDVDQSFILRGKERYNIYCSMCHGYTGDGDGLVSQNDEYPLIPTSLHSSTLDDKSDGYFFDVISNGVRNMPGYNHQIEAEDRWAIVTYLKALRLTRENK